MINSIKDLAIIAGRGQIPSMIIEKCQKENIKYKLFLLDGEKYEESYEDQNAIILKYGEVSQLIKILNEEKITNLIMAGGVTKPDFKSIKVDSKSAILLAKILANKLLGDESVLDTVVRFFEKEGLKVLKIHDFLDNIVCQKGNLTNNKPSKEDLQNIEIAKNAIEAFSEFDVGQSVIVAQKQIIAVEAVEGTDAMIQRCKNLNIEYKNAAILVKINKKNQSDKADLPTIGIVTIQNCINSDIKGIAIKSGLTLIVDKEKVIDLANKNGIFIIAL